MTVGLEKITAHYIAILASRRGRTILVLAVAIITIYVFLSRTDIFYQQPSTVLDKSSKKKNDADWSRFAYTQYVTSSEYLCNSVMLLERLHDLGSRADRVLMYPAKMLPDPETEDDGGFHDAELLIKARDEYDVKLMPIQVQHRDTLDGMCSLYSGRQVAQKMICLLKPAKIHGQTRTPSSWPLTRRSTSVSLPLTQMSLL